MLFSITTDQAHLRKYLATLGVAVMAGSLSLPLLVWGHSEDLLIASDDLAQLTDVARRAVEVRQTGLLAYSYATPYFASFGFLAGLAMATYGLVGWRSRQLVMDESEDLEVAERRFRVRSLTEGEREEQLGEAVADATASLDGRGGAESACALTPSITTEVTNQRQRAINAYLELEESLLNRLRLALPKGVVSSPVKFQSEEGEVAVDAALSKTMHGTVAVELKYLTGPSWRRNRRNRTAEVVSQAARLGSIAGPLARLVVVFVVEDPRAGELRDVEREVASLTSQLTVKPGVVALSRREFDALSPSGLRDRLMDAL